MAGVPRSPRTVQPSLHGPPNAQPPTIQHRQQCHQHGKVEQRAADAPRKDGHPHIVVGLVDSPAGARSGGREWEAQGYGRRETGRWPRPLAAQPPQCCMRRPYKTGWAGGQQAGPRRHSRSDLEESAASPMVGPPGAMGSDQSELVISLMARADMSHLGEPEKGGGVGGWVGGCSDTRQAGHRSQLCMRRARRVACWQRRLASRAPCGSHDPPRTGTGWPSRRHSSLHRRSYRGGSSSALAASSAGGCRHSSGRLDTPCSSSSRRCSFALQAGLTSRDLGLADDEARRHAEDEQEGGLPAGGRGRRALGEAGERAGL